jgi:HNH endonuclease
LTDASPLPTDLRKQLLAGLVVFGGADGETHWRWNAEHDARNAPIMFHRGKILKVRRLMHAAFNGPIPANMSVTRVCGAPGCVRPKHLALVPHAKTLERWRGVRKFYGEERTTE